MSTVDVDDEGVLSSIFKDCFPDTWKSNPDFAQYLAELSSYGVDKLSREPERLCEERSQALEQTQDLAFHNYKTFIETAECSRNIFQDFEIVEQHVSAMLEKLPELSVTCQKFLKEAQDINISRRLNSQTLQRHTQLLEILEMPQLMDTCVRNGYYEEALELATHVKRLEKKHPGIPIIMSIVNEVKSCSQLMLNQLIQQLRTSVQLPACLKVIGYLRRMDVFSEAELRIKFLQARDAWFQSILDGIPADEAYYHITKTIEASRVHLFDIITQYRAIFSDEDPILSTSRDDSPNEGALFHGWVVQKVSQFLTVLESDLQKGVAGRLDSLLGQCMYFGLSFSRVGADFRGLLAPIFQRAALKDFRQALDAGDKKFDESMQSFTLLGNPSALPSSAYSLTTQASNSLQPPISLLEFHPLAAYCNGILSAFNELRLCTPLSLACDVAHLVEGSLEKARQVIRAYHRAEETTFNDTEHARFGLLCKIFCEDLVCYMNRCLQHLFPPTQLSQALGVTVGELTKLGHIGVMDCEKIVKPMEDLLPVKSAEQTIEPDISSSGTDLSEDRIPSPIKEEDEEELSAHIEATEETVKDVLGSVSTPGLGRIHEADETPALGSIQETEETPVQGNLHQSEEMTSGDASEHVQRRSKIESIAEQKPAENE